MKYIGQIVDYTLHKKLPETFLRNNLKPGYTPNFCATMANCQPSSLISARSQAPGACFINIHMVLAGSGSTRNDFTVTPKTINL